MVATAVDDVQSTTAVRVGERHLARPVAASVRDVTAGSDVTTAAAAVDVSVNGREVDALLGVGAGVGVGVSVVGETHRLATARRALAAQDGATGSGRRPEAGSLQPLGYAERLRLTGAGWQLSADP